jgi:hypothetical protein
MDTTCVFAHQTDWMGNPQTTLVTTATFITKVTIITWEIPSCPNNLDITRVIHIGQR